MKRRAVDPVDLEEEHPYDIQLRIEKLEVRIDARRDERERLLRLARRRPWWAYLLFVIPYLLRGALYAAAGVGALMCVALAAVFILLLSGMQPR